MTLKDEKYLERMQEKENTAGGENRRNFHYLPIHSEIMTTYSLPGLGQESLDSVTSQSPQRVHSPGLALEKS